MLLNTLLYSPEYASSSYAYVSSLQILCLYAQKQVMGLEPTYSAWKADVLAVVLHLHISGEKGTRTLAPTFVDLEV